jgi:glutamate dehydrogenase
MDTSVPSFDPADAEAITAQLLTDLQQAAQEIAPKFIRTMPQAYFNGTTQAMRLAHVKAIIAAEASGLSQTLTLREVDGSRYTFISNQSYPGQLSEFVQRLPRDLPLISAQVYTSTEGTRVLDVFHLGDHVRHDPTDTAQRTKVEAVKAYVREQGVKPDTDAVMRHLTSCDADYLLATPLDQIFRHFLLVQDIRRSDNVLVKLEDHHESGLNRLTIGFPQYDPRLVFERVSQHLGGRQIDIERAHLDSFRDADGDEVMLLSFLVHRIGAALDADGALWRALEFDLKRLPHLGDTVFELAETVTDGNLLNAEILVGLTHLSHQRLVKTDPFLFSRERIVAVLQRRPRLAVAVSTLFRQRFATGDTYESQMPQVLLDTLERDTENPDERTIFTTLVLAVEATLRTNFLLPQRRALALRIDPAFLDAEGRDERPFGVFYVSGYQFDGFHVRFRDISRGGVRIVRPRGAEQYALESERLYDEVYGLAYAQQHKNKDIPEGGSKGVILAMPGADFEQVGRAYADGLLDLIIPDPLVDALHTNYVQGDELLYLGPDENISNRLITWVVVRARLRGHPMPDAFMSSKPGAGINHKAYGVTSEGVTVFLDVALRSAGIDPGSQPFTVKITGGPDGDVAGNEILILDRDYADKVQILGIADGSGCAEDPAGLDMQELIRLVKEELPIARFDPSRLGPDGRVVSIDQPGAIQLRNTLHNRIVSDAFIPAGGRPGTINEDNWEAFLDETGKPSSRVIVEGANLFITPAARHRLAERGTIIIKDSSANKAGVICSSYEIIASMLLDETAFLAIKERYVTEVLEKLRVFAQLEADALFREHLHKPAIHLPELSVRLSRVINRATDAITNSVNTLWQGQPERVRDLVLRHLPPVLIDHCGDRVFEIIPTTYLHRVIASSLASKIVYREGLDWLESMSSSGIARLAERYVLGESRVARIVNEVVESQLENREMIAELLEAGGVAATIRLKHV